MILTCRAWQDGLTCMVWLARLLYPLCILIVAIIMCICLYPLYSLAYEEIYETTSNYFDKHPHIDSFNTNVPGHPQEDVLLEREVKENSHPSQQDQGGYPHDQEDVLLEREVKRTAILHGRTTVDTLMIRRTCCSI